MPLSPSIRPANRQDSALEKRGKFLLLAFIGIIVGAVFANSFFSLTQLRQNVLDEKSNTAHKMVRTLVEQTADGMNAVELALQATMHSMQLVSQVARRTIEALWAAMGDLFARSAPAECERHIRHAGYGKSA